MKFGTAKYNDFVAQANAYKNSQMGSEMPTLDDAETPPKASKDSKDSKAYADRMRYVSDRLPAFEKAFQDRTTL